MEKRVNLSYEQIKEIASTFHNANAWKKANPQSSNYIARREKWLINICDELWPARRKKNCYWTKENCFEIARRCETYKEFRNSVAYQVASRLSILKEIKLEVFNKELIKRTKDIHNFSNASLITSYIFYIKKFKLYEEEFSKRNLQNVLNNLNVKYGK